MKLLSASILVILNGSMDLMRQAKMTKRYFGNTCKTCLMMVKWWRQMQDMDFLDPEVPVTTSSEVSWTTKAETKDSRNHV